MFSGPLSPSRPDPCLFFNCLSSSFFSLSGAFVDAVSLSLSLFLSFSLRRWGNPNPVWGLGFPLCSLHPGRELRLLPVLRAPQLPQGIAPRLFFFFFVARSPSRCFSRVLSCLVGVGGHGGCLLWSVMVLRCLCFLSRPSGAFFFLLGWWGSPCRVFLPPFFLVLALCWVSPCWFPVGGSWVGGGAFFSLPFLASSISSCI